ncbi:phytanoyl-CoA dioxygenase family protein [Synechococcus sp. NOUM97013]|uniref:phytanoyl-CoA dioxygenase family protein n=1 Tax=Synechococcus sp. NOUM97013 TaxID=1442555 RepID=UPI001647675A|nr:phytanoyl-CoA dioxygenase family protein [Synechococcus sp. NOUM97013]QNI72768.1 phytanoyl-CoA dioxygenase family protein [Synechococcus sp. NOUM97013]
MNLFNHFQKYGYCIQKGLVDVKEISNLLDSFEKFKISNGLYYSQSNHNWRRVNQDLDKYGLLEKSLENFTDLIWSPLLSINGKNILLSNRIEACLQEIHGKTIDFCMWQNMFFDKSTGTIDHIDTWYLDTDPMGSLIAAWIALEDIDGNGGEFHVYPGSHLSEYVKPDYWKSLDHDAFIKWSNDLSQEFKCKPIHLKKGDVLFWHPSLLHGSSNQRTEGHSRKSLTAHYYPVTYKRGGRGKSSEFSSKDYQLDVLNTNKNLRRFKSSPIYANRNRVNIQRSLVGLAKYALNFKNNDLLLMSRSNYEIEG